MKMLVTPSVVMGSKVEIVECDSRDGLVIEGDDCAVAISSIIASILFLK